VLSTTIGSTTGSPGTRYKVPKRKSSTGFAPSSSDWNCSRAMALITCAPKMSKVSAMIAFVAGNLCGSKRPNSHRRLSSKRRAGGLVRGAVAGR